MKPQLSGETLHKAFQEKYGGKKTNPQTYETTFCTCSTSLGAKTEKLCIENKKTMKTQKKLNSPTELIVPQSILVGDDLVQGLTFTLLTQRCCLENPRNSE